MTLLQEFNINELAGATGLILGALGGLLAISWKSRCHCRMNLCYLCQCERKPPPDEGDSDDDTMIVPNATRADLTSELKRRGIKGRLSKMKKHELEDLVNKSKPEQKLSVDEGPTEKKKSVWHVI